MELFGEMINDTRRPEVDEISGARSIQAPDVHSANAEGETEMATQETEQSNAHEATSGSLGRYRHRPGVLPQSTNGEKHLEKR